MIAFRHKGALLTAVLACCIASSPNVLAEDGYDLWLRYAPLPEPSRIALSRFAHILAPDKPSATARNAVNELEVGLSALLAQKVASIDRLRDGAIVLGTPASQPLLATLDLPLAQVGPEGYLLRGVKFGSDEVLVVAANTDIGLLYGVFELLRLAQTQGITADLEHVQSPRVGFRLLNHWDNLDRSVERGYAGQSIWDWWRLPGYVDSRYSHYARANASIGINGTVLNNVNAAAEILSPRFLEKVAAVADELRPWGIRVYLSVRFSSPVELGGLPTADPLDRDVIAWWQTTVADIYTKIPDFGGFLVKANSEGQPGPDDYGRSHAEGANMLASALRPFGGVVMWRAFVYSQDDPEDRVKQAYAEFTPLDGHFADNVLLQVKNGPLDFQPREPFHPLFGAMPQTPLALELQITQEYLGFSTHLAYLGPLYEEVLRADTHARGPGSPVSAVITGVLHGHELSAVAGVANVGTDRDWSGSIFGQANWYAFGRLAWDPELAARAIAEDWLCLTFSCTPAFVQPAADMMMVSREAAVDYMTPLGLAHLMATGHHYGPAPWVDDLERPEWNPAYYHRADAEAIGFDRTASGSGAVLQYAPAVAGQFEDLGSVPERYLLWFHRLSWDYRMPSGLTVWEELVARYDRGVAAVERMQATWDGLRPFVDTERFEKTRRYLEIQAREAQWWRDASIAYFAAVSGRELPVDIRPPAAPLDYYQSLDFPYAPGH